MTSGLYRMDFHDDVELEHLLGSKARYSVTNRALYENFKFQTDIVSEVTNEADTLMTTLGQPNKVPNLLCLKPLTRPMLSDAAFRDKMSQKDLAFLADRGRYATLPQFFAGVKTAGRYFDGAAFDEYDAEQIFMAFTKVKSGCYHHIDVTRLLAKRSPGEYELIPAAERFIPEAGPVVERYKDLLEISSLEQYKFAKINLSRNDYVLPVCVHGMNRSQILHAIVQQQLGHGRVSDAHGAESGFDDLPVPVDTFDDYKDDAPIREAFHHAVGDSNDIVSGHVEGIEDNHFSLMTGLRRRPKAGFLQVAAGWGEGRSAHPYLRARDKRTHEPVHDISGLSLRDVYLEGDALSKFRERDDRVGYNEQWLARQAARQWFTDVYFNPIVLRSKAPNGRVVFLANMQSTATILVRLVEAAVTHKTSLVNIYVVHLNAPDLVVPKRLFVDGKYDPNAVIRLYSSLLRFTSTQCCAFCGFDYAMDQRPNATGASPPMTDAPGMQCKVCHSSWQCPLCDKHDFAVPITAVTRSTLCAECAEENVKMFVASYMQPRPGNESEYPDIAAGGRARRPRKTSRAATPRRRRSLSRKSKTPAKRRSKPTPKRRSRSKK